MSGRQQGANIQHVSETLVVSHPAPLRGPSPHHLAEVSRKHASGDLSPTRSDGDPSWTSLVGINLQQARSEVSTGNPEPPPEPMVDPRGALRLALAERATHERQRAGLAAAIGSARVEVENAKQAADTLTSMDTSSLARWADGDRSKPAPVSSQQKRTELQAIAAASQRKLVAAQQAYDAAEPRLADELARINAVIATARKSIVLDEGSAIIRELGRLGVEADRCRARLRGLVEWARRHEEPTAVTHLLQPPFGSDELRKLRIQLDVIVGNAASYPDTLLHDPNATMIGE